MRLTLPETWPDRIAWAMIAAATAGYGFCTVTISLASPYWMDEVLAVWTARLPTVQAVWDALGKGAEFSPPLYHLLLQRIVKLGGDDRLALRSASIVAVYGVAWCAFVLVRRRREPMIAALAFTLCLASGLVTYAVQVRQYALVAVCFALAGVFWDSLSDTRRPWPAAAGIALMLALAIGLHFYAVLFVATFGLVEFGWTVLHRRVRWPVWTALGLAGLSILSWAPILSHVSAFNRGDTAAPYYYARPTPPKLVTAYVDVLDGRDVIPLSPLLVVSVTSVAAFVLALRTGWRIKDLDLFAIGACLIPALVFVFALAVSHTFNERYGIAAALGFALVLARCTAALPQARWVALGLGGLLILGMAFPLHKAFLADDLRGDVALLGRAPGNLPIATGNGLRFLELSENAGPDVVRRLVYLTDADEGELGDPTNEHQVERWKTIDPRLPVVPADDFLARNRTFLMFRDPDAAAEAPSLFDPDTAKVELIDRYGSANLIRVTRSRSATPKD
jgi:hypothetical protein